MATRSLRQISMLLQQLATLDYAGLLYDEYNELSKLAKKCLIGCKFLGEGLHKQAWKCDEFVIKINIPHLRGGGVVEEGNKFTFHTLTFDNVTVRLAETIVISNNVSVQEYCGLPAFLTAPSQEYMDAVDQFSSALKLIDVHDENWSPNMKLNEAVIFDFAN